MLKQGVANEHDYFEQPYSATAMKKNDWMPPEFEKLNRVLLCSAVSAKERGYDIRPGPKATNYVYGLGKAASKYKLAKSIRDIEYDDYVSSTKEHYTVQIKLVAAFIAFEAYARLRKTRKKWFQLSAEVAKKHELEASNIRKSVKDSALYELADFMEMEPLRKRVLRFEEGHLDEVFSIACALRNGFAHGLYGSRRDFSKAGKLLRPLILDCIKTDCQYEAAEVQK